MEMGNQPLVVLASARRNSDTRQLVEAVFQKDPYQLIDLLNYRIEPYRYENGYSLEDEFLKVIKQVLQHQVIVFATPVYWYAMSGLLKTFFDRLTDLVTTQKHLGRQLKGKTVYLLAVGSDSTLPSGFEVPFHLTASYLHMSFGGYLYASAQELTRPQVLQQKRKEWLERFLEGGTNKLEP